MSDLALPPPAELVDRRFGGRWTRAQALKNRAIRAGIAGLLVVVDLIPARLLGLLGVALGRTAALFARDAHRVAEERARDALGELFTPSLATRCFVHAGEALAMCALLRRPGVRASEYVALSDASRERLVHALSEGRGALVLSAHLGPFETIPVRLVEAGFAPAIVVRESYDPELDRVVDLHRRTNGIDVIHRGRPGAAARIMDALGSGRPVGILPDLGGRGLATTPVRFLGRTVAFPTGAQKLARAAGCPLLVGTLVRTPRGATPFELLLEDVDTDGTVDELTRRVAAHLEHAVKRSPEDWLWMAVPHLAIAADSRAPLSSEIIRQSGSSRA
ncbi:MAG TPA: lysophospholipid acyltransferase family protein [Polyangiaceae bacterium]|jgi:KDO2-lipid IV(A) lauroyltransferase|nr:lysophospholipid acyltransferase family protein [Polyangiaceae bacterium]